MGGWNGDYAARAAVHWPRGIGQRIGAAATWTVTLFLFALIIFTAGPRVEAWLYPAARGELVEVRDAGDEIEIVSAIVRKRRECSYLSMHARAGLEDLPIRFTEEFGNRPGGAFELTGVFIRKPAEPGPITVAVSVDHQCWPFWTSHSHLFDIPYEG